MINKIKGMINFYREGLGVKTLKIVMTSKTYDKILSEDKSNITDNCLFDCPIEINDKIIVDFYICENEKN